MDTESNVHIMDTDNVHIKVRCTLWILIHRKVMCTLWILTLKNHVLFTEKNDEHLMDTDPLYGYGYPKMQRRSVDMRRGGRG